MAQAKIVIPPDTICVGCGKPKRDHGSVYKAACDRFRTGNQYASVMDGCGRVCVCGHFKGEHDGAGCNGETVNRQGDGADICICEGYRTSN
jgi:hypothetical protein